LITVRTKIKQRPEDILEFEDKPRSIYPRILELELPKDEKQSCKRATFHPDTKQVEEFSK